MKANQFSNPRVRDLAWIISSSSLMNPNAFRNTDMPISFWNHSMNDLTQTWLTDLDKSPGRLEEALTSENQVLTGKIFETYLKFFFTEHPEHELLASNIQLIEANQTKGELDLIVHDRRSNETIHLEAACKFYLSSANKSNWTSWIGPNSVDSLDKKMRTLERQIGNIQLPVAQEFLEAHKIKVNRSFCLLKGYFFHHIHNILEHKSPENSERKYCSGIWMHFSQMNFFDQDQPVWHLLSKDRWFAPYHSLESGSSLSQLASEIEHLLFVLKRPVLLSRVSDHIIEDLRVFIVEDNWPH